MLNRRTFCVTAAATLGTLAARPTRALGRAPFLRDDSDDPWEVNEIGPGAWCVIGQQSGGNCLLLATDDGPILVDTKVAGLAQPLLDASTRTAGAPTMVINTHHHADHTGGNFAFSSAATVVAHRNIRPRLVGVLEERVRPMLLDLARRQRDDAGAAEAVTDRAASLTVDDLAATVEFAEQLDLRHGGVHVTLRHFGFGHTDNDLVVHAHDANIVHAGDLIFNGLHPFIDRRARATTVGWQKSLKGMLELCDAKTIVVSGHGEIGDRSIIEKQHDYFDIIRDAVQRAIDAGKSREEVTELRPEPVADYGFPQLRSRSLGAVFDELTA